MDPTIRTLVIIALVIVVIILIIWLVRGVFFVIGAIPLMVDPLVDLKVNALVDPGLNFRI
jgi:hypothetical protein